MKLTISRNKLDWREAGDVVCFEGRTIADDRVTVEVSREAWDQILVDWHRDPVAKLEEMSRDPRAHWARFATEKVWRLYL
jgi:hypothetical protein